MSNLSERQLLIITISVSVLLTGVLLYFVFSDRSEIDGINEEIAGLDTRLQAAEIERRKIPAREDKVLQFRAVEDTELAVLPTEQRITDFHRNISSFLTQADVDFQELPESSAEDSELAKGIRVTRNSIKGSGTSASILKFINMIENDPRLVAVKGFEIAAGKIERNDPEAEIKHEFEVNLETYFYRANKGDIRREHIPGAEARLQEQGLRDAITAFQPERPDTYILRPAVSRRDPLVDPRRAREVEDPEEQKRIFLREEEIVLGVEKDFREIAELEETKKALESIGDMFRLDRVRQDISEKTNALRARMEQVLHAKSVSIAELQARLEVVTEDLSRIRGAMAPEEMIVTRSVAESVLKDMREMLDKGSYNEVVSLGDGWTSFLRGKERMEEAEPVIEKIVELRGRAKARGEFSSHSFKITGVIVDPESPERSIACINGAFLRPGDRLDDAGEVTIDHVEKDSVHFAYKGEVIARPTGESGPVTTRTNARSHAPGKKGRK
jgi:hypothetical protein